MKWWIVLIIVIVVAGLIGGIYYWPKNKETSSGSQPSTTTTIELKFDKAASENDMLNDPYGPFYHKVYKAVSSDGLNFTQKGELIMDKASVPDVVKTPDSKLYIYAVDGAMRSNSGLMVALSEDNGLTWKQGSVQIANRSGKLAAADPQAVLLDNGSIRLFYLETTGLPPLEAGQQSSPTPSKGTFTIKSALSQDGINFSEEAGFRYQSKDEMITDPDVIKINDKWYMYLSLGPELIVTVSDDGNSFEFLKSIREKGSVSKTVAINNKQYRQYFCKDGIASAVSSDGLNWQDDPGKRLEGDAEQTICDPSPVKISDQWLMFYKVGPAQKMPEVVF